MTKMAFLLLAVLLAAGCGGSSSSPPPLAPPPPTTPPPPDDPQPPPPPDPAPVEFPTIAVPELASGFSQPVHATGSGDGSGRIFVVERRGTVQVVAGDAVAEFLDIQDRVGSASNEQGLLSIAFPPNFAATGEFYLSYTDTNGDSVIARYEIDGATGAGDRGSEQVLLTVPQPFTNHNGGLVTFGPDGLLYIGIGDGGGGDPDDNAQDPDTLLGTILRIDPDGGAPYAIPADNPFGNEVWAYGLRNPWRFSFDRATGDLYIADVGENLIEEVNFLPAGTAGGANFGWKAMEGSECFAVADCDPSEFVLPVYEYQNADGNCSVTGGFVARGANDAALQGIYVYGDFCSGRIWGLANDGDEWRNELLLDTSLMITSFGEADDGRLLVVGYTTGTVHDVVVD